MRYVYTLLLAVSVAALILIAQPRPDIAYAAGRFTNREAVFETLRQSPEKLDLLLSAIEANAPQAMIAALENTIIPPPDSGAKRQAMRRAINELYPISSDTSAEANAVRAAIAAYMAAIPAE